MQQRNLVTLAEWTAEEVWEVLETAQHLKRELRAGVRHRLP